MLKNTLYYILLLICFSGYSQKVALYKQFYGSYDFTMLGNTMNVKANGDSNSCEILTESSAILNLNNNKQVVAAYLYWSGNGTEKEADLSVMLNDVEVQSERTNYMFIDAQKTAGYFSAFSDVTSIVSKSGSGTYILSDLDLTKHMPRYCGGNYVGWAMVVVYEDLDIEDNLVAIYDGFESLDTSNPIINIVLDGFRITNTANSKISFLAWEGDASLASGEELLINNITVFNTLNPANNAFNCTNTYSNSTEMWNMDLDEYDLSSYVEVDDTVLDIKVTTAVDVVFFNTIVLSVYSVFPDATMTLDSYKNYCYTRVVDVNYTIANHKGNHPLKKDTPIAFYINNELIGTAKTDEEVAEGSEITQMITLDIPKKFGYRFDLVAVVDDLGTGKGVVYEIDEENNFSKTHVDLTRDCPVQKGVSANSDGQNDGFDLSIYDLNELKIYNRYGTEVYKHGKGYTNQWVGQDKNNRELPTGTYYYVFTTNFETISGYVYLIKEVR